MYVPPYTISETTLAHVAEITRLLEKHRDFLRVRKSLRLRRRSLPRVLPGNAVHRRNHACFPCSAPPLPPPSLNSRKKCTFPSAPSPADRQVCARVASSHRRREPGRAETFSASSREAPHGRFFIYGSKFGLFCFKSAHFCVKMPSDSPEGEP